MPRCHKFGLKSSINTAIILSKDLKININLLENYLNVRIKTILTSKIQFIYSTIVSYQMLLYSLLSNTNITLFIYIFFCFLFYYSLL